MPRSLAPHFVDSQGSPRSPRRLPRWPGPGGRPVIVAAVMAAAVMLAGCTVSVTSGPDDGDRRRGTDDLEESVSRLAEDALEEGPVAGMSIAVARHGDIVMAKGFGYADIENDVRATERTVYRIGSITKQFTAAAILQLVEQGELALDDPMSSHYGEFDTQGHTVTVRQLLNHTSGIRSYTGLGEEFWGRSRLDLSHDDLLDLVRDEPFDFAPGDEYRYNNTGYYLLGVLIEQVTGQAYSDYLADHVFAAAGLESTTYCSERPIIPNRAEGYEVEEGALVNDAPLSMTSPFAAGALCSTVLDLIDWTEALFSGQVVDADSLEAMTTPGSLNDGSAIEYGFGLGIGDLEGHRSIRHGGGINGFVTMLAHFPDDELTITVLTNTPGPTAGRVTEQIARLALDLEMPQDADLEDQDTDDQDAAGPDDR